MLSLSQLPFEFRGTLYDILTENEPDTETIIPKKLKIDLIFNNLGDILQTIDTCIYLGCDFPFPILDYVKDNAPQIQAEVTAFVSGEAYQEYNFFMTTQEFQAVKVFAEICNGKFYKNHHFWWQLQFIENDSVILMKYIKHIFNDANLWGQLVLTMCMNGSINLIKYYSEFDWFLRYIRDTEFACKMCAKASARGQLEVLRYLREVLHANWDETSLTDHFINWKTLSNAKKTECFCYAIENGCPIDKYAMTKAIANGRLEEVKILFAHGCPIDKFDYIYSAYINGYVKLAHFLHENGCQWDTEEAALYGLVSLNFQDWLQR